MMRNLTILIVLMIPFLAYGQGKVTRQTKQSVGQSNNSKTKGPKVGTINGHEWVDLGLPSGTKWATCNVGTDKFDYYGGYFVWGNIQIVNDENERPTYYNQTSSFSGLAEFDPAKAVWGGTWRTPTREEFQELIANCTFTWTDEYDGGVWAESKSNGQKIYFPACGGCSGTQGFDYFEIVGLYWSSSAAPTENTYKNVTDYAYCVQFMKDNKGNQSLTPSIRTNPRHACLSIRPVMSKK